MRYEIIDDNGTIHAGSEDEMREAFAAMTGDVSFFDKKKDYKQAVANYGDEWSGDLKLIQVIDSYR